MQSWVACTVILCLLTPARRLHAQEQMKAAVALECGAADDELGKHTRPDNDLLVATWPRGTDSVYLASTARTPHSGMPQGLMGLSGFVQVRATGGPVPPLELAITAVEKQARPIDERQLVFLADDTLRIDVGSMSLQTQTVASVPGIWQTLSIEAMPGQFTALARAHKLRATLGTTRLPISNDERMALQALWIGARCGARAR